MKLTLEERVRRFHIRATAAFLLLALGGIGGLALERHDAQRAARLGREATRRAAVIQRDATRRAALIQQVEAHNICVAVNEVRGEAQSFVVKLAPNNPIPKNAGLPLRTSINRANAYKRAVRSQARASFKIAHCP